MVSELFQKQQLLGIRVLTNKDEGGGRGRLRLHLEFQNIIKLFCEFMAYLTKFFPTINVHDTGELVLASQVIMPLITTVSIVAGSPDSTSNIKLNGQIWRD
jgi:hypothetical protein